MGQPRIRVTERALAELEKRSAEEGRTVAVLVERWLFPSGEGIDVRAAPVRRARATGESSVNVAVTKAGTLERSIETGVDYNPPGFESGVVVEESAVEVSGGSRTVMFDPPIVVQPGDDVEGLIAERCPKCGCPRSAHESGASKSRCERHPACVWKSAEAE